MPVPLGSIAGSWPGDKTQAIPIAWNRTRPKISARAIFCCSGNVLQCPSSLKAVIEVTRRWQLAAGVFDFQRSYGSRSAKSSTYNDAVQVHRKMRLICNTLTGTHYGCASASF